MTSSWSHHCLTSSAMSKSTSPTTRMTRSRAREQTTSLSNASTAHPLFSAAGFLASSRTQHGILPIVSLPQDLTIQHTSLIRTAHALLLRKQRLLQATEYAADEPPAIGNAIRATLVFAAHHAGTAVCIAPEGIILTAAHCVADTPDELADVTQDPPWLLFSDGNAVRTQVLKWDARRDLVLLLITHAQSPRPFPYCPISFSAARVNRKLVCIGHPGSEDLEAPASNSGKRRATGYDVLSLSRGRYRGLASDQDPQDNSEIGALKHDCWTYWGHSGAPLVDDVEEGGKLLGLHSSWDEETGMRRGVDLVAIRAFLQEWESEPDRGLEGLMVP